MRAPAPATTKNETKTPRSGAADAIQLARQGEMSRMLYRYTLQCDMNKNCWVSPRIWGGLSTLQRRPGRCRRDVLGGSLPGAKPATQ